MLRLGRSHLRASVDEIDICENGVTGVGGTVAEPVGTTPTTILTHWQFRPHRRIPWCTAWSQLVTTTKMSEIGRLVAEIWQFECWHKMEFGSTHLAQTVEIKATCEMQSEATSHRYTAIGIPDGSPHCHACRRRRSNGRRWACKNVQVEQLSGDR